MKWQRRRFVGFTLVEMAVTLTIIGVLLMIAAPAFQKLMLNQGIKSAAFDLYSALQYARSEAIKRNGSVSLRAGASSDGAWTAGWRVVDSSSNSLRTWTVASSLALAEKASNATVITFARDGHVTSPSAAPKLQIDPVSSQSGVTTRCVGVDLIGRPTTQMGACS